MSHPPTLLSIEIGDWIQIALLLAITIYTWLTSRLAKSNNEIAEYTIRPVLVSTMEDRSEKCHVWFQVANHSKTNATALVIMRIKIGDGEYELEDAAYCGKQVWHVPALHSVTGHHEFSGAMKQKGALSANGPKVSAIFFVYYRAWNRTGRRRRSGKNYYGMVQTWDWSEDNSRWIPVLATPKVLEPPEADWAVLDSRNTFSRSARRMNEPVAINEQEKKSNDSQT